MGGTTEPNDPLEQEWLRKVTADDQRRYRMALDILRTGNPKEWGEIAKAMQHQGSFDRVEQVRLQAEMVRAGIRFLLELYDKHALAIAEARIRTIVEYFVEYGQELDAVLDAARRSARPPREVVDEFLREFERKDRRDRGVP